MVRSGESTPAEYLAGLPDDRRPATGHKLDTGKSCVRFSNLDKVPLDVVGDAVARVSADDMIHFHDNARHGDC